MEGEGKNRVGGIFEMRIRWSIRRELGKGNVVSKEKLWLERGVAEHWMGRGGRCCVYNNVLGRALEG